MATMKAIRMHDYGGPHVLRYEDVPRPEAGDGEVLVRVFAAGVNPIDWKIRAGYLKEMVPLPLPWTPGFDFSGVIDKVGKGVADVHVGDEVFGKSDLPRNGSYAEYIAVPRSGIVAKPRNVDHVHAAGVPLAALTAWQALFGNGQSPVAGSGAGNTALILGGSGGVGSFAIQLARWKGARVVATTRHRAQEQDHLAALGVDTILDLEAHGIEEAGPVDVVVDLVGGELQQRAWSLVNRGGALVSTMGQPSETEAKAREARALFVFTQTNAEQLAEIAKLIDAGTIEVVVGEKLPLESARRAHERLEQGGVRGKVVLTTA